LVNHNDLADALTLGLIGCAGLDVTDPEPFPLEHPLHNMNNCGKGFNLILENQNVFLLCFLNILEYVFYWGMFDLKSEFQKIRYISGLK